MPINIRTETVVSYLDVVSNILPSRDGRRVHVGTLHRWRTRGLRGVRLHSVKLGGRWHTSVQALQRFFDALTYQGRMAPTDSGARPDASEHALTALKGEGF
jgi:hypothetical protein